MTPVLEHGTSINTATNSVGSLCSSSNFRAGTNTSPCTSATSTPVTRVRFSFKRSIRPVAIGRKNYLFFGSLRGGQTAATLYSVVQSARLYPLDVTAYLTDVLRRLPAILPTDAAAIRPLLPDQWAQSHPEHIHASRDEELKADTVRRRKRRAKRRQAMVER